MNGLINKTYKSGNKFTIHYELGDFFAEIRFFKNKVHHLTLVHDNQRDVLIKHSQEIDYREIRKWYHNVNVETAQNEKHKLYYITDLLIETLLSITNREQLYGNINNFMYQDYISFSI